MDEPVNPGPGKPPGLFDFGYPHDANRPVLPVWGLATHERVIELHKRTERLEQEIAVLTERLGELGGGWSPPDQER